MREPGGGKNPLWLKDGDRTTRFFHKVTKASLITLLARLRSMGFGFQKLMIPRYGYLTFYTVCVYLFVITNLWCFLHVTLLLGQQVFKHFSQSVTANWTKSFKSPLFSSITVDNFFFWRTSTFHQLWDESINFSFDNWYLQPLDLILRVRPVLSPLSIFTWEIQLEFNCHFPWLHYQFLT